MKREQIGLKLDSKLLARLRAVTVESKDPYAPTMTEVISVAVEKELKLLEKKPDGNRRK